MNPLVLILFCCLLAYCENKAGSGDELFLQRFTVTRQEVEMKK
jgi:hypothetical protein